MTSNSQVAGRESSGWSNWSGSQHCQPRVIARPTNESELAELVRTAKSLRVVGAGHSFSALVPTDETLVSLQHLCGIRHIDDGGLVTCGAGTTIHDLGEPLYDRGFGLINQGDVDAQTLAGACSTGTHGTGPEFGCLATDVAGFRLVTAQGDILTCNANSHSDIYHAGRVALGTLGVMSEVTMQCRPKYSLVERLEGMSLSDCLDHSEQLAADNRHFEFFLFPYAERVLVKTTNLADDPGRPSHADQREDQLFGWACQFARWFPRFNPALQRTIMRWYPGRERCDRAYRIFPSARTVRFNEMEYEVPVSAGVECFREVVATLRRQRLTDCFPLEFRRVKGDALWLSPFYERDSVSISVHRHHSQPYEALFQLVEPVFWKYEGRPHWGKLHTLTAPQLAELYPRWRDFCALREHLDSSGKFVNRHIAQMLV